MLRVRVSECINITTVLVVTVSGAPETAAIEPFICRPLPPAIIGYVLATCGIALTASGIASAGRRFCGRPLPPQNTSLHLQ